LEVLIRGTVSGSEQLDPRRRLGPRIPEQIVHLVLEEEIAPLPVRPVEKTGDGVEIDGYIHGRLPSATEIPRSTRTAFLRPPAPCDQPDVLSESGDGERKRHYMVYGWPPGKEKRITEERIEKRNEIS
jgi:hypothetical protein